jgi:hypothetical protein
MDFLERQFSEAKGACRANKVAELDTSRLRRSMLAPKIRCKLAFRSASMSRTSAICSLCLILCSCAYMDCMRLPETLSVRVQPSLPPNSQMFQVTGGEEREMPQTNGVFLLDLPLLGYGYREVFGIIPVGQRHPERHEYVILKRSGKTLYRVSVASLRSSPRDPDGACLLRLQ